MCGRADRLKARYTLSESGQDAHVSLLTGRATAASNRRSRASKIYASNHDYVVSRRASSRSCRTRRPIVLPYDGLNPLPPQFCYLKPHYLDVQTSYFDHLARGAL